MVYIYAAPMLANFGCDWKGVCGVCLVEDDAGSSSSTTPSHVAQLAADLAKDLAKVSAKKAPFLKNNFT